MAITKKNNREVWIGMVIIFGIGLSWNTYYTSISTQDLVRENQELAKKVTESKLERDSARMDILKMAKKLTEIHNDNIKRDMLINSINSSFTGQIEDLKKDKNEEDYIPIITDDERVEYLSNHEYKPY